MNGDGKSVLEGQKKHNDLLNDPLFVGEEFFFPPLEDSESDNLDDDFTEERFKKLARKILSGESAIISRNVGRWAAGRSDVMCDMC